jgi:hypothetical protein
MDPGCHRNAAPYLSDMVIKMTWDQFYNEYNARVVDAYPSISNLDETWQNKNVISPYYIELPQSVIDSIIAAVKNIFRLSRQDLYRESVLRDQVDREIMPGPADNLSVLMSYDFHLEGDTPRLLEINTNASGYLVAEAMYRMHKKKNPFPRAINSLKKSFINEFRCLGLEEPPRIAIIDEEPRAQKMYPEFLCYKSLFENWGYTAGIHDYKKLSYKNGTLFAGRRAIDFIYNRYCDFTLSDPSSNELRHAYLKGICGFSPNPKEYILLADKRRLVSMSSEDWLESVATDDISIEAIRKVLLPTWRISDFSSVDEIWQKRKQLFFKPPQSYAGKGAYRGKSISRKVFSRVVRENSLIQQYAPAPKITFEKDKTSAEWKYDLRAYAYGGEVQLLVARIYQGQVTNFNRDYGGYCPVFVR